MSHVSDHQNISYPARLLKPIAEGPRNYIHIPEEVKIGASLHIKNGYSLILSQYRFVTLVKDYMEQKQWLKVIDHARHEKASFSALPFDPQPIEAGSSLPRM